MDLTYSAEEIAFRDEVRTWLHDHLEGEFAALGGRGGPADEQGWEVRHEWERVLGADRWVGLAWPEEYNGRNASIVERCASATGECPDGAHPTGDDARARRRNCGRRARTPRPSPSPCSAAPM